MADPLSIAAGIIAILQASKKAAEGLEFTFQLRRRDVEFRDLKNQLSALQMQLQFVALRLQSMSNCASDDDKFRDCLAGIKVLFKEAEIVVSEIDAFVCLVTSQKHQGNSHGGASTDVLKPPKRLWIKNRLTMSKLTQKIIPIVSALVTTTAALHGCTVNSPSLQDQQHSTLVLESIGVVGELADVNTKQAEIVPLDQQIFQSARDLDSIVLASQTDVPPRPASRSSMQRPSLESFHSAESSWKNSSPTSFRGTLSNETSWTRHYLGSISFHGNTTMLLNRRPCNMRSCGRGGSLTIQFAYYAPAWTFCRHLNFYIRGINMPHHSTIFLRSPIIIPDTALVWSMIESGNLSELRQMLVRKDFSPHDICSDGMSLLYFSAFKGQEEIYSFLLNEGADPYFRNQLGITAMQPGMDRVLSGTRVDRESFDTRPNPSVSDQIFVREECLEEQQFSLLHQIVLGFNGMDLTYYLDVEFRPEDLDMPDVNGRTPLLWAAWRGDRDSVASLLGAQATVDRQDNQGFTPLARAAKAGHRECVRLLLEHGASYQICTNWGAEPIHLASDNRTNGLEIVKDLVNAGADPQAKGSSGSPLHNAANLGSLGTVKYLLSRGVEIDLVDADGDTPAMIALMCCNEPTFCFLAEEGARLDNVRKSGENILHIASWVGSEAAWEVLRKAANQGRLASLDVRAEHEGHDIWHCLDECRGRWYRGKAQDEKALALFRELLDFLA